MKKIIKNYTKLIIMSLKLISINKKSIFYFHNDKEKQLSILIEMLIDELKEYKSY